MSPASPEKKRAEELCHTICRKVGARPHKKNRNQAHHVTLFAITIEGEVFARNVTVEAFAAMANRGYGAVNAEGRQDVIMGNKEANALSMAPPSRVYSAEN